MIHTDPILDWSFSPVEVAHRARYRHPAATKSNEVVPQKGRTRRRRRAHDRGRGEEVSRNGWMKVLGFILLHRMVQRVDTKAVGVADTLLWLGSHGGRRTLSRIKVTRPIVAALE